MTKRAQWQALPVYAFVMGLLAACGGRELDPPVGGPGSPVGAAGSSNSYPTNGGQPPGGSSCSTGGSSATGSGGTATPGTGGTSNTGGAAGSGNSGGSTSSGPPVPPCLTGEAKNGACTAAVPEGESCYKTCGPDSVGFKLETCTGGLYVEGLCQYASDKDYSCYKVPSPVPPCPEETQAAMACDTPACQTCGPTYLDSVGAEHIGYCDCSAAGKWTCGSTSSNSWPCQPGSDNPNPGCN
jgi:hypothetical protein